MISNERIWVYTFSKEISPEQMTELKAKCKNFVDNWTAHEVSLDATFSIEYNRFLIIKVNEQKYNASGCSIDKQLRFIKDLEALYGIELLNRLLVAYLDADSNVQVIKQSLVAELVKTNHITENTLVFDNTIATGNQLQSEWKKALKDTYLAKYLSVSSY